MKPIQFFTDDYLEISRKSSPTQIATFLDDYRTLHAAAELRVDRGPTKLISIRLPVKILSELKALSKVKQVPYQTLMKQLIEKGLK
jgi:predicted DNA binding CopG/RHH family protein